ncbi:ABC transporter substrate-binding protein [Pseudooceanicola algae]|uniref:Leucine-, isoleucine-, valine-, threonine-, and alanine-binding protein n=1 Tax=Pseudooceanicola algae TaxID=1537215 RepID=A0A418SHQ2_9RHOB|nr:ABC transporter substrate-binding protein [Pseudooceanicola algae]QPM90265.1 Leucine-, isoleucine-, valine-, threonine-, and alanine-binding protein [Pseudooceanicola algae]
MKLHSIPLALAMGALAGAAMAADPVKVGVITTLSGPAGYLGADVRDGMALAIEMSGAPVELVVTDDGRDPAHARQIAEDYVYGDDIKIVTGIIFSNIAGATVPDVVDEGAIYISPNAAPSTMAGEGCHENYFVTSWQNDSLHEASGLAANELGYETAYLLAPNYQAGKDALTGFKRTFEGEIVGEGYTQLDQTDYSTEMAQIRAAAPDVVFQFHPGGLGIAFAKQYQQAGLLETTPMVMSEPNADGVILKALGEAVVGLYATGHWSPDLDNEANTAFVAAWEEKYGDRPITYYGTQGYDTGLLIASALEKTGGVDDIDAFREALREADFDSVRGDFSFGQNQHPVQDWYLVKVEMGENGVPTTVMQSKLVEGYGDVYADQCEM